MSYNIVRINRITKYWYNVVSAIKELIAIIANGTQTEIITLPIQGSSGNSTCGFGVELELGKYICFEAQLSNQDNQNVIARGITQTNLSFTLSTSQTDIFAGTADLDPYARGQAVGGCPLNSNQALCIAPIVGTGNVFKIVDYSGGSNNVSVSLVFNDGDTSNYIDRFPNFHVLTVTGTVYTIASTGLSQGGAFPYARVWDVDISGSGSATPRGIIYPMGTSGSGNGKTTLVPLGTVGGKECFALFYAKSTSSSGVAYYAVYEYNTSTNTLVETVGDTLYKSGANLFSGQVRYKIDNGVGIIIFEDNKIVNVAGVKYDGSTFLVGVSSTFGSSSLPSRFPSVRPYYNGEENSTSQFIIGSAVNQAVSGQKARYNLFPASYNSASNLFTTSDFDGSDSDNVLQDSTVTGTTFSGSKNNCFIGQKDHEFGFMFGDFRDGAGTFRGSKGNSFQTSFN